MIESHCLRLCLRQLQVRGYGKFIAQMFWMGKVMGVYDKIKWELLIY